MYRITSIAAAIALAMSASAIAAPPLDADPALHAWFERQHNVVNEWCCNLSDGHVLSDDDWRSSGGRYEVRLDGSWWPVDRTKLRDPDGGPNPTGHAIVWYVYDLRGISIYCFTPGYEG